MILVKAYKRLLKYGGLTSHYRGHKDHLKVSFAYYLHNITLQELDSYIFQFITFEVKKMGIPCISRECLHHNFLKSIILRLDFQGVLDLEMEKLLLEIKSYLKSKGFTRYEEKLANQIKIAVSDFGIETDLGSSNIRRPQKVYSFSNETKGYGLDISSGFVCLNINSVKYIPFEEYSEYLTSIAAIYKKSIDFFTVKRFGIRKINECLFERKEDINEYFSGLYFSYFNYFEEVNTLLSNRHNSFSKGKYRINLDCNIQQGKSNSKTLYKVLFDIDAYLDNSVSIEETIYSAEELRIMNDLMFEIYIDALTQNFLDKLKSEGDFDVKGLIGVERNE